MIKSVIEIDPRGIKKIESAFNRLKGFSKNDAVDVINRNGLKIVRDIKKPPIPVDTGNLRRNVIYDASQMAIKSQATYSGYLEFVTKFMRRPYPFFFGKIEKGLMNIKSDLNNRLLRLLK